MASSMAQRSVMTEIYSTMMLPRVASRRPVEMAIHNVTSKHVMMVMMMRQTPVRAAAKAHLW